MPSYTKEQREKFKSEFISVVERLGVESALKHYCKEFKQIVRGAMALKEGIFDDLIAKGFEHCEPEALTICVEHILDIMPEGDEKIELQECFEYWIANKDEIAKLHNMVKC